MKRIYVREGKEYVGPFATFEDASRFLALIYMFGESIAGIEVIEAGDAGPGKDNGNSGF